MTAKHWWAAGALGLTLCLSATSVQAEIRSSAELGELRFSVFDLDPSDGIDPAYTLFTDDGLTQALVVASNGGPESQLIQDSRQGWLAPVFLHAALPGIDATAAINAALRAEGHAPAEPHNSYGGNLYSTTNGLLLAPHTRLDIVAPYQIFYSFGDFAPTADTWGYAAAQVGLFGFLGGVLEEDVKNFSVNLTIDAPDAPLSLFDEGIVRISIANDSGDSHFANLVVGAQASGNIQVLGPGPPPPTPIPEPSSVILLMVGVGILIRKKFGTLTAVRLAVPSAPDAVIAALRRSG
jgi:hypothetical protein